MKKKLLCLLIVLCLVVPTCVALTACHKDQGIYTYHGYTTALGTNWNPHTWEMNADSAIMEQTGLGFVDSIYYGEGAFQWHYEMATEIKDVTATASAADKTKWGIEDGQTGRMWQIKLNPNAKWENGEAIKADDYVWSMKMQLSSELKNYRENSYYANDFEIVNANIFYNQDKVGQRAQVAIANEEEYNSLMSTNQNVYIDIAGAWGVVTATGSTFALITDETKIRDEAVEEGQDGDWISPKEIYETMLNGSSLGVLLGNSLLLKDGDPIPAITFDDVGLYKVDEYTIMYVCAKPVAKFDFMVMCNGASWLVHKKTYEDSIVEAAGTKTSKYGTSKETTMCYGPYKMESFQKDKQIVWVQNENWYGWEKERGENGELVSYITLADGQKHRQFQMTTYVIDVMTDEAAKQAFLKGDIDELSLDSDDIPTYATSDRLSKVDETYTMRFFFNTGATEQLDKGNNNKNSVVLTNKNFRNAFSLAIDRSELCTTATAGFKPAFSMLNTLYYYNVAEDPTSIYRTSEWGMKTVVELYDIEYGADKQYKTLEEAYNVVTGYDLTKAKQLMKTACDELVAAGKYKAGDPIKIQVGFSAFALTTTDTKHQTLMNQYLNAAAEGSGFGTITLEYVGSLTNRYKDVTAGNYAIGYGAWGGAAFYPFKLFECYLEPDEVTGGIHEQGCFDPKTEVLKIDEFTYTDSNGVTKTFAGKTLTWESWSKFLKNASLGNDTIDDINLRLALLSRIEKAYIEQYYCVPIAGSTIVSMQGYRTENITQTYNIMYGFGGIRFTSFNYTDAEWAKFVKDNAKNGVLPY